MASNAAIRFVLDGRRHEVSDVDPNTTILDYLRDTLKRTGTKEGCAEGDCGACTVVVGSRSGKRIRFRAVNACIQFLPTLDGKLLFTVESLRGENGRLHPVQRAMVNCHGSQCGFCTPGFVMSLFALYRSERDPSRQRVCDVLAGNLCRCTGYRPILDAAEAMYQEGSDESGWLARPYDDGDSAAAEELALLDQLEALSRNDMLELEGRGVEGDLHRYFAPNDLATATALLRRYPDALLLAGGTDVGLWATKDHRDFATVIYLGNVEELLNLETGADGIDAGAAVPLTGLHGPMTALAPALGELLRRFASPPIRNTATLGGNIVNGSPIGDAMPALIALGARLVLYGDGRRRELALEDFYRGYRDTVLEPGEILERIRIPAAGGRVFRAYKISRRFDQDITAVLGAFCLRLDGRVIREARIAFGGMAATPARARRCEAALEGRVWNEQTVAVAQEALDEDYAPIDDLRAGSAYRRLVARNLLMKCYLESTGTKAPVSVLQMQGTVS